VRLIRKIKEVYKRQVFVQSRESWSAYRFFVFFFSLKGQKRILKFVGKIMRYCWRMVFGGSQLDELAYAKWRKKNTPGKRELVSYRAHIDKLHDKPLISIVIPVFQPNLVFFNEAVNAVRNQLYPHWELCLADDCSNDPKLSKRLSELAAEDARIKVIERKENGHISACSNTALSLATGQWVSFMDQDDLIPPDALYHFACRINEEPEADLIYSDEDKITARKRFVQPHFKPAWCPDNFLSRNYLGHLVVVRHELVKQAGGFRLGFEGSQDYDLLLRITEHTNKIAHLPRVLYHWRMHEGSTAMNEEAKHYAFDSGVKALNEAFQRRNSNATAVLQENKPGFYTVNYALETTPKVSIIIPTRNNAAVLSTCLTSIFERSSYTNFNVILINNNSNEQALFDLLDHWQEKESERFTRLDLPYEFNFSKLMNDGVKASNSDYILLLNNDTEVLQENWIENMLCHAQRKEVGAVGVKLIFPNDTIQHGGVVIGMGGVAGHTFIGLGRDEPGYFYYLTSVSNYSAVTAACLMVKKSIYLQVGGFDESLAVEYNDVDFCLKLVDAGFNNVFVPDVELYHYESLTRGHPHANRESYKRHLKEVGYFKSKWQAFIDNDPCYNPNLSRISTHFEPNVMG
jgi:GT2 family glycosyltransferase